MTIEQLHYFIQIAKTKNLTSAAATLHITEAAISKAIKNLESELGLTLFVRTKKETILSPDGENIYDYAVNIINTASYIDNYAKSQNLGINTITIGSYVINLLQDIVPIFQLAIKENNIEIIESLYSNDVIEDALLSKKINFAITNSKLKSNEIESIKISNGQIVCVVPKKSSINSFNGKIILSELKNNPIMMLGDERSISPKHRKIYKELGIIPIYQMDSALFITKLRINPHVAFMTKIAASKISNSVFDILEIEDYDFSFDYYVSYQKKYSEKYKDLITELKNIINS